MVGISRDLTDVSPKMFSIATKESTARALERKVAESSGAEALVDRRACMDIVRSFVSSSKHSETHKTMVSTACFNALWTRNRLEREGYIVEDNSCERCGGPDDSIFHRLWLRKDPEVVQDR